MIAGKVVQWTDFVIGNRASYAFSKIAMFGCKICYKTRKL